ncbi:DUF7507 domain-containing protein [Aurantimicrobium minutum]|uniref:DUF7507 domain-containing protein n=1 Tax=Aurantimicrobium minutum TaxID=708131 RepID=UPI0024747622|nr:InlB B-repeat-containing protein [Aurantimicrobium minutum]MDH6238784.1 putative repeat protein (TIGR02543 family) [Aurantimicrobium minutum]
MLRAIKFTRGVFFGSLVAMVFSLLAVVPAHATTDITVPSGQAVQFNNNIDIGTSAVPGFTQRYGLICPSCSQAVDGIVTVVGVNGGRFNVLDYTKSGSTAPINTQMSAGTAGGSVTYQVSFVLHETDDPVTMQDIYVNVTDIDSRQWAQFSGVQQYSLSSNPATKLVVQTNATNSSIPVGAYRFAETNNVASNDADQDFWAQVKYTKASSIIVTLAKGAGSAGSAVFGVSFNAASWTTTPTPVIVTPSTYALSYDVNSGTGGSVPSSQTTNGSGNVTVSGNTGSLTKPGYVFDGWNTLPDGNGVSYGSGDVITPTADMTLYAQWKPNFPQMQVVKQQKTVDPVLNGSPATVDYDVTVKNVGNVPLTNINITDNITNATLSGAPTCSSSLPVATLNPGSSFVCTYTATPVALGNITNTAVVSSDQLPNQTSNTVTTIVSGTHDLQVYKIQTSVNPEQAGETVTFNVVVFNAGSNSQANVNVTDANGTVGICTPAIPVGTLAAGASITCPVTHVVSQDEIDAGVYTNTAVATSTHFNSGVSSNTVTVRFLQFAALDLEKAQNSEAPSKVGDVIVYDILATNKGNIELTNFTITDPGADPGSIDCGVSMPTTMQPGTQLSCVARHTITKADIATKSFTNIAYATSTQLSQQASNGVTTDLSALAATGSSPEAASLFGVMATLSTLSGIALIVLRKRMKAVASPRL